jgi:hypothetical protein
VLLVPADAVMLVFAIAEQFDDLSAAARLAVEPARLDPVAYALLVVFAVIVISLNRAAADSGIGVGR